MIETLTGWDSSIAGARALQSVTRYRLPEPTRLADRLASRRDTRA